MVLSALVLKLLATHINHDGPQSYGSAVCMLDGMGTQIILGCPGGPWPWLESYVRAQKAAVWIERQSFQKSLNRSGASAV